MSTVKKNAGVLMVRPWGRMRLFAKGKNFWAKTITVKKGARTSLQKHKGRGELWMCIEGEVEALAAGKKRILRPFEMIRFPKNTVHRLGSKKGGTIIEIAHGLCEENDSVRLEDDYGRADAQKKKKRARRP